MKSERELREALVAEAMKYLGQRETHGSNRSPFINMLAKLMGIPLGTAWCAMFVSFVIKAVCDRHGLKRPFKLTASSQACFTQTPEIYQIPGTEMAKAGALAIQQNKSNKALGHVWMNAKDMVRQFFVVSIEGNTNKAGSREGDGVYSNERSTKDTSTRVFRGFADVARWIAEVNGLELEEGGPKPLPSIDIAAVQRALNAHGFMLAVDGQPGPKTIAAVQAFQKKNIPGSKGSGVIGPATLKALGLAA